MLLRRMFPALLLGLAACAQTPPPAAQAPTPAGQAPIVKPDWAFEQSDIPVDPDFRFGKLANGMRYVIRQNARPAGTALVRFEIASGSLSETESERGYAHFVEHMAFNGSTRVPEGEMIKLLERDGLAFGADTNATTNFEQTTYKLDLPRNDPALLDTALMLMRETASELTFEQEAVERERGVVLSEMRDRNDYGLRNYIDRTEFLTPDALYAQRLPIGTVEALNAATGASLKAFWAREYVPANATLVVIGDFDPALVEAAIGKHFADWQAAPAPIEPDPGPIPFDRKGLTDIYIDPALSERVSVMRHGPWIDGPDTIAERRRNLLREIGYAIVNRRLARISRQERPPFRGAGFGTGDIFKAGRTTRLLIDSADSEWKQGLTTAAAEYARALASGFSEAEVAEQVAEIRSAAENAAASQSTRSNGALAAVIFALIDDGMVPSTPQSSLERLLAFISEITPQSVLEALKADAVPLKDPLLRFEGRKPPEGGADAIRKAWDSAIKAKVGRQEDVALGAFDYTDFGTRGQVVSDQVEQKLGIREVVFANGVRLNIKRTDLQKDRVLVQLNLDGGQMLNTPDQPIATAMTSSLPVGGLGKHSQDDLQSILAGRDVVFAIDDAGDTFRMNANVAPRDLELQLQLMAATITDPGYRSQGEIQYRRNVANFFARKDATPGSALANALGGILSDNAPRFTLRPEAEYKALSFARLRDAISDRLRNGAIEIAIVGDVDEQAAIDMVARTFGALPAREPDFRDYAGQRLKPFTENRERRVIRHKGQPDQALLRFSWPTKDDSDPVETLTLELLSRIVRIELTDSLREALGKAYSPSASSNMSRIYRGYGTFDIAASVDVSDVEMTRKTVLDTIASLRDAPVPADVLKRAREPMLETYDNALKGNGGWMSLVDRAQTEPERIDRFLAARQRLEAVTAQDLQDAARRYLEAGGAVEVDVLPANDPENRAGS